MKTLYVFGVGGQAREVAELAEHLGYAPTLLAAGEATQGGPWPILPEAQAVERRDALFAIGIGDNAVRARIAGRYEQLRFPALIHPDATVAARVRDAAADCRGLVVQAGARISVDVQLGEFCNLNLNATVSHDCRLGEFVTVSPGASVGGNVEIGKGAWIGLGGRIKNGAADQPLIIGENAMIGVGAVVVGDCDPGGVYVGVPARRLR